VLGVVYLTGLLPRVSMWRIVSLWTTSTIGEEGIATPDPKPL
jgi:hypothetical protein